MLIYNLPSSVGANIYGLYLDPDAGTGTGLKPTATIEGLNVYSVNSEIIVNATEPVSVVIYTISGMRLQTKYYRLAILPSATCPKVCIY